MSRSLVPSTPRYKAGGQFRPHFDGPWVPEHDWASVYTVVVYLNDDFQGGRTTFLEEQPDAYRINLPSSSVAAMSKRVRARMRPMRGSALLFNHDVLHEGTPVADCGKNKYILRAEVMFSRVDMLSGRHNARAFEVSRDFVDCRRLYKEAALHESKGESSQFCSTYLRALKLQFAASRSIASQFHKNQRVRSVLSPHGHGVLFWPSLRVLTSMLSFLMPASLCALMATGRSGCAAGRLRSVWFGIALHCAPFRPRELRVLHDARLTHDWLGFYKVLDGPLLALTLGTAYWLWHYRYTGPRHYSYIPIIHTLAHTLGITLTLGITHPHHQLHTPLQSPFLSV